MALEADEELIAAVAAGDEGALGTLYGRHGAVMLRLLRRLTADVGVAEDMLQEAWLAVWRGAGTFRGESSVRGWLLGVARRTAHDKLRRRVLPQSELEEAADVPDREPGVEDQVLADAGLARIEVAISHLPQSLREVVVLALVEELPYRDVAAALGVPVGTVKSRMSSARRRLSTALRADGSRESAYERKAWRS